MTALRHPTSQVPAEHSVGSHLKNPMRLLLLSRTLYYCRQAYYAIEMDVKGWLPIKVGGLLTPSCT